MPRVGSIDDRNRIDRDSVHKKLNQHAKHGLDKCQKHLVELLGVTPGRVSPEASSQLFRLEQS